MPDALEDLESRPGDGLMGGVGVLDGDDRIVVTPHDHRRDVGRQVEAVDGADGLPTGLDHAPHRAHERLAVLGTGQGRIGPPHLADKWCSQAAIVEKPANCRPEACDGTGKEQRHELFGSGEAAQPKDPADLPTESAGTDEHESVAQIGVLIGELHGDATAEALPDDRCAVDAENGHEVAQTARHGAQRVVAHRLGGFAMTEEIGRDHVVVLREWPHHVLPGHGASGESVDQDDDLARAGTAIADVVAVDRDMREGDGLHASSVHRFSAKRSGRTSPSPSSGGVDASREPHPHGHPWGVHGVGGTLRRG